MCVYCISKTCDVVRMLDELLQYWEHCISSITWPISTLSVCYFMYVFTVFCYCWWCWLINWLIDGDGVSSLPIWCHSPHRPSRDWRVTRPTSRIMRPLVGWFRWWLANRRNLAYIGWLASQLKLDLNDFLQVPGAAGRWCDTKVAINLMNNTVWCIFSPFFNKKQPS